MIKYLYIIKFRFVVNCKKTSRIRICGSGFKNTDPGDPKKTGSNRIGIRILLRYVLMFSKINSFYGIFIPNLNILWHLKSKTKNYLNETVFRQLYITRKFELQRSFCGLTQNRIRIRYLTGSGTDWPKKT